MTGNNFGKMFRITTFGESHGEAVGVVMDGVKPGLKFDIAGIQKLLDKRKPGQSKITTARKEKDKVHVLSGLFEGKTLGTPICLVVYNKGMKSKDYEKLKNIFRPGHAGFTYLKKYGIRDYRGGGRASGRETVARVAAGAFALQQLKRHGVKVTAYVKEIGNIKAKNINLNNIDKNPIRCPDIEAAKKMEHLILETKKQGDSVGGIVEVIAEGVLPGLGEPVFGKLDAELAKALMSIGAVKGVEIGSGFKAAKMKGSENNDLFIKKGNLILTKTNNAGGIIGGISTGMPIVIRVAVKPTSSIAKPQWTLDLKGRKKKIQIKGRHDPCICPRVVPVVEAMVSIVLYDSLLKQKALKG